MLNVWLPVEPGQEEQVSGRKAKSIHPKKLALAGIVLLGGVAVVLAENSHPPRINP
jgi:hypothetical protein